MKAILDETIMTNTNGDEMREKKVKKKKRKRTSSTKSEDIDEDNGDNVNTKNGNNGVQLDTTKSVDLADNDKEVTAVIETNTEIQSEADDDDNDDPTKKSKRKRKRKRKSKSDTANDTTSSTSKPLLVESHDSKIASLDRTIYVEGLPFDATEADVRDWFAARIQDDNDNDIEELRLATWHDTGRLRGYGHVVFKKSRDKALASHGETMGKRYLTIVPAKAPKLVPTMNTSSDATSTTATGNAQPMTNSGACRVVFVKNLPYHATEDDILQSFQVCGKILDGGIRIARHSNNTAQSKGFAYVEYKNPEGAQGAVEKASKPFGLSVLGRPVFVDYDDKGGRMKGSYKLGDGRLWTKQYGAKK